MGGRQGRNFACLGGGGGIRGAVALDAAEEAVGARPGEEMELQPVARLHDGPTGPRTQTSSTPWGEGEASRQSPELLAVKWLLAGPGRGRGTGLPGQKAGS